jgi:hypothetical protein
MTRPCRICGERVRIRWERGEQNATAADASLVAIYDDHGLCPGSFEPLEAPAPSPKSSPETNPRRRAAKKSRLARKDYVLRLLLVHPRTSKECSIAMACSLTTSDRVLLRLFREGVVERSGSGRNHDPFVYAVRKP